MTKFAHESEEFIAAILDHFKIKWVYEQETFIIQEDEEGTIKRALCPDFYLPDYDIYIEVTVMKKATRKRKKIGQVQKLRPEIKIVLLDRDCIHELEKDRKAIFRFCVE